VGNAGGGSRARCAYIAARRDLDPATRNAVLWRGLTATKRAAKDYLHVGPYDQSTFSKEYAQAFKGVPKFNLASMPDLLFILHKIGADPRISDVRWAAYMLATAFIESSHTVKIKQGTGRKSHMAKVWRNFAPIEEAGHGKGRRYYAPVKVKRLPTGDAQVTEQDGDQWRVSATTGDAQDLHRHQKMGVEASATSPLYARDDGDEQQYFGRGYVQLTWWSNYAKAGMVLGRGLAFLYDPDLVEDPNVAYAVMASGLCTGKIFANGRKLSQYFHGTHTDYVNARMMVNPGAKHANKEEVAHIAERFEKVLFTSIPDKAVAAR
jgi:hypothetical protein